MIVPGSPEKILVPNAIYLEPHYACGEKCVSCYIDARKKTHTHIMEGDIADKVLSAAKDLRIRSSVNLFPFVSLDGLERLHDERRRQDSFREAIGAMDLLQGEGVYFGNMITMTARNWEEVSSIGFIDTMIEHGSMMGVYSLLLTDNPLDPLRPSAEEYALAIARLRRLARHAPIYLTSTHFGMIKPTLDLKGRRLKALTIDPYGCVRTERAGHVVGDLHNETLMQIIEKPEVQRAYRVKFHQPHYKRASDLDLRYSTLEQVIELLETTGVRIIKP